jgi:hypothetical protein
MKLGRIRFLTKQRFVSMLPLETELHFAVRKQESQRTRFETESSRWINHQ